MTSINVEILTALLADAPAKIQVWLGRADGPIVAVDEAIISTDPYGNPCVIIFEKVD